MKIIIALLLLASTSLFGYTGIVKSRRFDNVYWAINEGEGKQAYLHYIDGIDWQSEKIKLQGLKSKDWRDLTVDDQGNIYILQSQNNDQNIGMKLIKIKRPKSYRKIISETDIDVVNIRYPSGKILDLIGIFHMNENIYFMTSQFAQTRLYKVDADRIAQGKTLNLEYIGEYPLNTENIKKSSNVLINVDIDDSKGDLFLQTLDGIWHLENFSVDYLDSKSYYYSLNSRAGEKVIFNGKDRLLIVGKGRRELELKHFVALEANNGGAGVFGFFGETKERVKYLLGK